MTWRAIYTYGAHDDFLQSGVLARLDALLVNGEIGHFVDEARRQRDP